MSRRADKPADGPFTMEQLGTDFNATGSVMSKIQLEELRKKRGECVICGRKCFHKKLFKMIPISDHGRVLNGRCLQCNPLDVKDTDDGTMPAVSRPATQEEQKRFTRSQSNLTLGPGGGRAGMRRGVSSMSILTPAPEGSTVSDGASMTMSSQSTHTLAAQSTHSTTRPTPPRTSTGNLNQYAENGGTGHSPLPEMIRPEASLSGRVTSNGSSQDMSNRDTSHSRRTSTGSSQDINIRETSHSRTSHGNLDINRGGSSHSRTSHGNLDINRGGSSHSRTSHGGLDMTREENSHSTQSQQRSSEDSGGAQPLPPVQRQSIDHPRISGQTAMRSTSGSSLFSLMSTDSALTHDSPYDDFQEEEYDDYTPLPLEKRPSGEQLEDALERITGHNIDEEEAFALASVGVAAHPSAAALLEYYRRTFRESQRSLRSSTHSMGDSSHGETIPQHGMLNRGGAVSFGSMSGPSFARRQPSGGTLLSRSASDQTPAQPRRLLSDRRIIDRQPAQPRRLPSDRGHMSSSSNNLRQSSQRSLGSNRQSSRQLRAGSARSLGSVDSFEEDYFEEIDPQERTNSGRSPFNAPESEPPLDAYFSLNERDQGLDSSIHSGRDGGASIAMRSVDGSLGMRPMMNRSQFGRDQDISSSVHSVGGGGASNAMRSVDERPMMNRSQFERDDGGLDSSLHSAGGGGASNTMRSGDASLGRLHSDRSFIDAPQSHRMTVAKPSLEEQGIVQIKAAGAAYAEILSVMRDFPGSPAVQTTGLQELSNLNLSPQDSDMLAQIGAIQVIVEAMRSYPRDMELQICGCRAMWNVSGTSENQLAFVEAGGLDVILNNMEGYLDFAEVQEQALAALGNLGAVEANLQKIIEVGTVRWIVEGMNKHSDNVEVQMKGCTALTNLASHVTPLKKSIMEAGGGGAVVISMVMHPSNPALQEKALRALRNLSAQCEENKLELANIGGIDAVVTAMQVHRDISGVQEAGAWALSNMAGNVDVKVLIGDCGGIDVIIRAMWVHSDSVSVQEWCCRALYTLSLDRHNSSMVLQVGGISAVVNAMQAHNDSSVVQEMGCAILCNLAVDQACKMRVVDEEALDAIVLAMVLHGESCNVQECACQVLLQLAIMENFKAMQASNIGELVRVAADKFPHNCDEPARRLQHILEGFAADYTG